MAAASVAQILITSIKIHLRYLPVGIHIYVKMCRLFVYVVLETTPTWHSTTVYMCLCSDTHKYVFKEPAYFEIYVYTKRYLVIWTD